MRIYLSLAAASVMFFIACTASNKEASVAARPAVSASLAGSSFTKKQGDSIIVQVSGIGNADTAYLSIKSSLAGWRIGNGSIAAGTDTLQIGYLAINVEAQGFSGARLQVLLLPVNEPKKLKYRLVETYPHSKTSYTQGLVYDSGVLLESTGLYGRSKLMEIDIKSGKALREHNLGPQYFGEGLALAGDKLYQLTWRENKGFIYSRGTFEQLGTFSYPTEGWGLCFNGSQLIMSDGSHFLYFIDTASMAVVKKLPVLNNKGPVTHINEMQYIGGYIFANIYMTDIIVRINASTGEACAYLDAGGLLQMHHRHRDIDVLNGIARNPATGRYYLTGKNYPVLFEVEIFED
jgi:glutaminyl-peptide cyclotransferase